MLPNSELVHVKNKNRTSSNWKLTYIYKIAPKLKIISTPLGQIEIVSQTDSSLRNIACIEQYEEERNKYNLGYQLNVSFEITSKRYRHDLQGVSLICGLVVC